MKKMKQEKIRKIGIASALGLVVLVMLGLYGASNYMLNYSLNYPKEERMTAEHWKNRMKTNCGTAHTAIITNQMSTSTGLRGRKLGSIVIYAL